MDLVVHLACGHGRREVTDGGWSEERWAEDFSLPTIESKSNNKNKGKGKAESVFFPKSVSHYFRIVLALQL